MLAGRTVTVDAPLEAGTFATTTLHADDPSFGDMPVALQQRGAGWRVVI